MPKEEPREATRAASKFKGPVVSVCFINQCPIEIILKIAEYLESRDLGALLRTSWDFYTVISTPFYSRGINNRCALGPSIIEWAAWKNQPTLVQKFQTPRGREAFSTDKKNKALGIAASVGHLSTIVPLLEMGAEISSTDYVCQAWPARGFTPLHYAACHGYSTAIEILLAHGADSEGVSDKGQTALQCAVGNGHEDCVRVLVEKGTNVELEDPLGRAISWRNKNMVRLLLELGANPSSVGPGNLTLCESAMMKGQMPIMELLLEKGADPEYAYGYVGKTLLHHAVQKGKKQAINLLLKYGADISSTDDYGLQPLHYAAGGIRFASESRPDIVLLLLEAGAQVSAPDNNGHTARDYALCSGNEDIIELMMQDQVLAV